MKNHGIQRKTKSSRLTMIISRMSAQIVMIGIDSEQMVPKRDPGSPHGAAALTVGIVGATVMPHVVYLHSALQTIRDLLRIALKYHVASDFRHISKRGVSTT